MMQPRNIIASVLVLVVVLGGALVLTKDDNKNSMNDNQQDAYNQNDQQQADQNGGVNQPADTGSVTQEVRKITIKTAKGEIKLELYPKVAPKTVENFITLTQKGFYNNLIFHRVVPGFVIQGGDPLGNGTGGPGYQFEDEINPRSLGLPDSLIKEYENDGYVYNYSLTSLPNEVGSLSMANAGPNTNGSQFFIITDTPQPHLNGRHTVFGKVVSGMDVVKKIQQGDKMELVTVTQ